MILPFAKLGTLALKTMAKPIAIRLKTEASRHPQFRQFIINLAQTNHRISTNIQRRIYGHSTNVEIRPLNEEKAVQAAADLIGELFVFSVAGAAVIFEVQRSARSEARKEEARKKEVEGNQIQLYVLQSQQIFGRGKSSNTSYAERRDNLGHGTNNLTRERLGNSVGGTITTKIQCNEGTTPRNETSTCKTKPTW
ncbi:hypothetical protein BRADI_3g11480v3 [Brachypodium distachyon]|uniref:OPA3-like protein n=1 Tax=Brachypodium distachyon TaxID=15368 RepID=A0A0Q3F550_BRADI|nr:hypothetical protein BRADI_3g11480v3 [Brachypodium distachyon]